MAPLLFSPRTRRQPKRNLREASRRVKNPVMRLEVWKVRPRSSGYYHALGTVHEVKEGRGGYFVVNSPEGEVLGVVVFPEPLESDVGFVVGVLTFPLIDGDSGRRKCGEGMFRSLLLGCVILLFFLCLLLGRFLWFSGSGRLLGRSLFLRCCSLDTSREGRCTSVLEALLDELGFAHDGKVWLVVADQSPESDYIGEFSAILCIEQLPISHHTSKKKDNCKGI